MSSPSNQTSSTPQAQTVGSTNTLQAWLTQPAPAPAEAATGQPGTQATAAAATKPKKKTSQPIKPHKYSMLDPPEVITMILIDHLGPGEELVQSTKTIANGPIDVTDVINRVQNEADCALALVGAVGN